MYIDPELNIAREELLIKVPGGFNAPAKIEDRRGLLEEFLGAIPLNVNVDREDIFIPGPDGAPEPGPAAAAAGGVPSGAGARRAGRARAGGDRGLAGAAQELGLPTPFLYGSDHPRLASSSSVIRRFSPDLSKGRSPRRCLDLRPPATKPSRALF